MPKYQVAAETPVPTGFAVDQVRGMFDLSPEKTSRVEFDVELPADDELIDDQPWRIGVIVGPSGSGKSTVARHAYGKRFVESGFRWDKSKAVVDQFGKVAMRSVTQTLTSVGFSSPPPHHQRSRSMPSPPPKALTIDAYWAWAIAHGEKRVENRGWRTHYRGPLLIHAGLTERRDTEAIEFLRQHPASLGPAAKVQAIRGTVIAVCDLVDCIESDYPPLITHPLAGDPFAFGPWCWVLANVRPLAEPIACTGKQGLWTPPSEVLDAIL